MRLTYVPHFHLPDHKGWTAVCGSREEGLVEWRADDHPGVLEDELPAGWSFQTYVPHENIEGEGYGSFEETCRAFEEAVFGEAGVTYGKGDR